ncbi:hypothetical protein Ancab_006342 [Ancistrocladus abbreviatus]
MYTLLPQIRTPINPGASPFNANPSAPRVPPQFLRQAVFAGGSFWALEAAYGRVNGVVKTATGYCGGSTQKPTYREICEGGTGHTEAIKVVYDCREISYGSLCDVFWETHDPTKKDFLDFGLSTHHRSAIFYSTEEERKQAQGSKIRRQMRLNRRIVTKILPLETEFFMAENEHHKYYLQKHHRLCGSLGLRSTEQFVESELACKLNGALGMDTGMIANHLSILLKIYELPNQAKLECDEIIQHLSED